MDTKVCCRNNFRMTADIGAAHDLITVYFMEWLAEGNEIVSVRSRDLVSVLQHIKLLIHMHFLLDYMSVQ